MQGNATGKQHQENPGPPPNLTAVAEWATAAAVLALWEVIEAYEAEAHQAHHARQED